MSPWSKVSFLTLPACSSGGGFGVAVGVGVGVGVSSPSVAVAVAVGVAVCAALAGLPVSSSPPASRITATAAMTAAMPRNVRRCARVMPGTKIENAKEEQPHADTQRERRVERITP